MPRALRLRIFAGPNGSGKSTMYDQVRNTTINGRRIDIGHYINADEIARTLKEVGQFDFKMRYGFSVGKVSLLTFAQKSGLMRGAFDESAIANGHEWKRSNFILLNAGLAEQFAQLLVAYLCDLLIQRRMRFSFETVFSHPSKLDLMRRAKAKGFKVYLYFIATNSPEINKDRVRTRVLQNGHDVPAHKIEERYELALKQVLPAIPECYHAFMFDNSGIEPVMFAEMKETAQGRGWAWNTKQIPDWFIRNFLLASEDPMYHDVARTAMEDQGRAK